MPVVRTIQAYENELVEVTWTCRDGSTHTERYAIPPKPVRHARRLDVIGGPGGKASVEYLQGMAHPDDPHERHS